LISKTEKINEMRKIKKKSIAFLIAQYFYCIIALEEAPLYLNFMEKQFSFNDSELSKSSMSDKTYWSGKPDFTLSIFLVFFLNKAGVDI
jgi:hypothetical protein